MAAANKRIPNNGSPVIDDGCLPARRRDDDSNFKNRTRFRLRLDGKRKWASMGADVGVWLMVIVLLNGCYGYQEQRFAMEPQDQVGVYFMAHLSCVFGIRGEQILVRCYCVGSVLILVELTGCTSH